MRFNDFIKEGKVRKGSADISLADSLFTTAAHDLIFLETLKVDEYSARKILCGFYDVIRSLVEALATLEGYKVYSHEAFTAYLKENGEDMLSLKFDRYRKIRNKINYYGEMVSADEVKDYIFDMKKIINILQKMYAAKKQ